MLGLITKGKTNTNDLQVHIPDELKNMDLQVIILPADKENEPIDFFTDNELKALRERDMSTLIEDKEDYSNQN